MDRQEDLRYRWVFDIYEQEFLSLKLYAFKMINNETDAEEIVGNSFSKLWKMYTEHPGKFSSPVQTKAYLAVTVKHACFRWSRKKPPVTTDMSAEDIPDDDVDQMVVELEKHDLIQRVLAMVEELPDRLKEVITLSVRKGLSIDQIAQQLNVPVAVIYVYRSRAIKELREMARDKKLAPYFVNTELLFTICLLYYDHEMVQNTVL